MTSVLLVCALSALAATPSASNPSDEQVRAAIQKSIPYLETAGVRWMEEKKCSSCHRVGSMVWTLGVARSQGFTVSDKLNEWYRWSVDELLRPNDKGTPIGGGNKEGVAQVLMAQAYFPGESENAADFAHLQEIMLADQQQDGSWKPGGQLPSQKRPLPETTDVSTIWQTVALVERTEDKNEDKNPPALEQALQRINAQQKGASTEWYAARLVLASELGEQELVATLSEQLREQQREDGGWGWMLGDESDAFGTGLALYALLVAGTPRDDEAVRRGQEFLIDSQREDGSWAVKGTKEKKKTRVEETAVYWGTAWAALALCESLPR